MSRAYFDALVEGARRSNIPITEALAEKITAHFTLVEKWAAKMNLTAVTDPIRAASLHGVDSLLFLEHLPEAPCSVVDVGSGAGFPGIVVALARPDLAMTLVEPKRKRASFLRVALADLDRSDVAVQESRLEAGPAGRPFPCDVLLSRATIPPLELLRLASGKLRQGGRIVLTSGAGAPPVEVLQNTAANVDLLHVTRREHTLPTGELRILDVVVPATSA